MDVPYEEEDLDLSGIDIDLNLEEGKYAIVKYEDKYYPGKAIGYNTYYKHTFLQKNYNN